MIFNRTQSDVNEAITIRAEKIQKGIELTSDDVISLERGMLTFNTLNRIEEKQETLKNLINELGYWNTNISNNHWDKTKIFTESDFQRIINNTKILSDAFLTFSTTPKKINTSYHFDNINSIERILYDLDLMIDEVKSLYKECGNIESGDD